MVRYDFDRVIDRKNTDCLKWDKVGSVFGNESVLPLWVADMDFAVAKPITEALRKRTEHEVYGYTPPSPSVVAAVVTRLWQKYSWKIEADWLVFTPGVVPALNVAVRAFSHPGDDVIIQGPVYYPFWRAVTGNGATVANNQLRLNKGHYEMDFEDLAAKFTPKLTGMTPSPPRAVMMILCSPHNPVGRVWHRDELARLGEIVIKNGAVVVSDEIHCELLFKGSQHTPFASMSDEFAQNSVICMAPSKTFNLAGLGASLIIIPNKKLRDRFNATRAGILPRPNVLGLVALEAAYRYGDEWLEQLLEYLENNLEFLMDYFEKNIPQIKVIKPEGTYLIWLDCRGLGMEPLKLRTFMREKAMVGLDDGFLFGPFGAGFQRINIASPRSILEKALKRIEAAVAGL